MIINGTPDINELYANKDDQVFGFEGDDILDASNGQGNNLLDGGSGSDRLLGNNNDTLKGGAGEDSLYALGSSGFNILEGGEDNDQLFVVEGGNNQLNGGSGRDRLIVTDGSGYNILAGGLGNDFLDVSNGTGNNTLNGNEGDDILIGGLASDRLFGNAGDDFLFGGKKGSQLTGGTGLDRFFITSAAIPEVPIEVLDFTKNDDKVIVAGIPEVQTFADLLLEQRGLDTVIKASINGELKELGILRNVQANTLTPTDFDYTSAIFAITNSAATEGSTITFIITRTGDAQTEQSVTISTSIAAEDTASNSDFVSKTQTLTFQQGETQKSFTVDTTQDLLFEGNETFSVSLSNPHNGATISPTDGTAKGTINNDDAVPVFAIAPTSATEGNSLIFTITRTGDAPTEQSVIVSTSITGADTASNTDFVGKTQTLTFQQGETQKSFTVDTTQDFLLEGNETFSVSLSNPTNGAIISPTDGTAKGTINNDENTGVTITQTDGSTKVTEGGTTDSYSVVLASQPTADVIITINNGQQITTNRQKLTFTSVNWNVPQNVTVAAVNDSLVEGERSDNIQHTVTSNDVNYNGILISPIAVSITDNDIPLTQNSDNNIFTIKGETDKVKLRATLTGNKSNSVDELGVFVVDDPNGNINGIAPGAAGYTQAALQRANVIFSVIAKNPNGFNLNNLESLLEFNSGDNLRFYLIKNSTTDAVQAGLTPITNVLLANATTTRINNLGNNVFSIGWESGFGNTSDFEDLVIKIQTTNQALPVGTNLQSRIQGELIDLRGVTQLVKADFVVNREAAYNNFIGFYRVTNENGGIDTNNDGTADILPGQAGYTQAAVRSRISGIDLTVNNQGTATYTGNFQPGSLLAPFIIINGRPDVILDSNPNNDLPVYFPFLGANTDKVDHIRLLGNNVFGFEDLPNGGDQDFNDTIVRVNLSIA